MTPPDEIPQRILIVDSDPKLIEDITRGYEKALDQTADAPAPIFVNTVRESQSRLADRSFSFLGVFVCPDIGSPAWVAVVRAAHKFRAGIPIYVVCSKNTKLNHAQLEGLGVGGYLDKPLTYDQLIERVGFLVDGKIAMGPTRISGTPPPARTVGTDPGTRGVTDQDVVEIDLASIAGSIKSAFDVYVRLEAGRFIKVLRSGDELTADRLENYRQGGAAAVYILKSALSAYLDCCDALVAKTLGDDNAPIQIKTSQVLSQGESTLRLLRDFGFTSRTIERVNVHVGNTIELVKQISTQSDLIRQLLFDIASVEHAVGATIFSGLLVKHIGGATQSIFNGVGLACFLHDISLLGQPPEVREENEAQMSPEQVALFHQHPAESARLVLTLPQVPKSVVMGIAHHHMKLDGSGFPAAKPDEPLNRLGELIGISEDFLRLADLVRGVSELNPVQALYASAFGRYSQPVLDAFMRAFAEK